MPPLFDLYGFLESHNSLKYFFVFQPIIITVPAFLFGTFLGMVIAYLIDMDILGIP